MNELIAKSMGYILLIILGYVLKKKGILNLNAKDVLGKILMYVTLPFAFIANFRSFKMDTSLIIYFALGLLSNLIMIMIGKFLSRHKQGEDKALYLIECSGYNVGAFATPFISSIYHSQATIVSSMFDIGNSIMCVGGIYPLAKREVSKDKGTIKEQLIFILKKLFSSVPFDTYLIMFLISLLGLRLPEMVSDVAADLGAPSIIITMVMIGIAFEIKISKDDIWDIIKILASRYIFAIIFVIGITLVMPELGDMQKTTLCICVFAPATSISPTYCGLCGCKPQVYGAVSSISVIISLFVYVLLFN